MTLPHIEILKAFEELPFNLGKSTLADFMKGNPNASIEKNRLDELKSYGTLYQFSIPELRHIIDELIRQGYLQLETVNGKFQVVKRTSLGVKEILEKNFTPKEQGDKGKRRIRLDYKISKVTEDDKKIFQQFDFFLSPFNDEQKKGIISPKRNLLCIAGAGSGKTTVLTRRIEFLTKFRSVRPEKVLAITFTRKARDEMEHRLERLGVKGVSVETFNSFSEKNLRKHASHLPNPNIRVAEYRDKIQIIRHVMNEKSYNLDNFAEDYFNKRQLREKSRDELFFLFVNDIFSIIDSYKNRRVSIDEFYEREKHSTKRMIAKIVYEIAVGTQNLMSERGLRDFSDQIIHTIELFEKEKKLMPLYDNILIDEFQDLNQMQFDLVKLLTSRDSDSNNATSREKSDSPSLFAVGDPRQAIYGWRGSDLSFIVNFSDEFEDVEVLSLNKNYRSVPQIVELFNSSIRSIGLEDLVAMREKTEENSIFLFEHQSEQLERIFVAEAIKNSKTKRNEIFVLARTNRILENFADFLTTQGIKYTIKSEEEYKSGEPQEDEVVLATVHSIKGMEAQEVYVVSANTLSFPNKVQDNFILSLIKEENDYDKNFEELRLFYVALSRAKDKLVISYTGNPSKFINEDMLSTLDYKTKQKSLFSYASETLDSSNTVVLKNMIRQWRAQKAQDLSIPAYMVFSNSAVDDIVRIRPSSKDDLLLVNGLGPQKIAKYGDEILKIVNG